MKDLDKYLSDDGFDMLHNVAKTFKQTEKCTSCNNEFGTSKVKVCSKCYKVFHFACIEAPNAIWICNLH